MPIDEVVAAFRVWFMLWMEPTLTASELKDRAMVRYHMEPEYVARAVASLMLLGYVQEKDDPKKDAPAEYRAVRP